MNPTEVSVILLIYCDHHSQLTTAGGEYRSESNPPRLVTELHEINERPVEHQMACRVACRK